MSRRFGRNQRRRAREALAAAESQVGAITQRAEKMASLASAQGGKLVEAESFQHQVARLVGRNAIIAGEPTFLSDVVAHDDYLYMPIHPEFDLSGPAADMSIMAMSTIQDETLRLLDVRAVRDLMRQQVHVTATLADESVGYFISERALRGMTAEHLARQITPELARALAVKIAAVGVPTDRKRKGLF